MRCTTYQIIAAAVMVLFSILLTSIDVSAQIPAGSSSRSFPETKKEPISSAREVTCPLTLTQAPELRGFRLNMNIEQVQARIPGLIIKPANALGVAEVILKFFDPSPEIPNRKDVSNSGLDTESHINRSKFSGFDDVHTIHLEFLDGRLFFIRINYKYLAKWRNLDEFVMRISEPLHLPANWGNNGTLECNGFKVSAELKSLAYLAYDGYQFPILSLEDSAAKQTLDDRRKDADQRERNEEEQRRRSFKP